MHDLTEAPVLPRPAVICQQLLQAMDASEGRRKRRKRNTTPDALGMEVKRALLEAAIAADPAPDQFDAWLFSQVQDAAFSGATRAMAMQIRDEWEFAIASGRFREWLTAGAPSEDGRGGEGGGGGTGGEGGRLTPPTNPS
jgi:hypothetical protein